MDRNVWCSECGKYVGLGHEHDDTRGPSLPLIKRADIFKAAVDRYVESPYSGDPRTMTSEELAEAMEIIGDTTLTDGTPYYSPTIQAAKKYIESQEANIIRAGKKLIKARQQIFKDSLLTLHTRSNGDYDEGPHYSSPSGKRIYNIDENFGYNIDEDLGAL